MNWIHVKDGLPKAGQQVLIHLKGAVRTYLKVAEWFVREDGEGYFDDPNGNYRHSPALPREHPTTRVVDYWIEIPPLP